MSLVTRLPLYLCTFLCLAALVSCAQPLTTAGKGFFWKAEKDGRVVYLLGSFHVIPVPIKSFSPEIETALTNVDIVALEQDFGDTNTWNTYNQMLVWKSGNPEGHSLNDYFNKEEILKISNLLPDKLKKHVTKFQPWAIEMFLSLSFELKNGYYFSNGADMSLYKKLQRFPKIKTGSLDSPLVMLNARINTPVETYISKIKGLIVESNQTINTNIPNYYTLWITGDFKNAEIFDLSNQSAWNSTYVNLMIHDRNDRMVKRIKELSAAYPRVMAVAGYSHMTGPRGLPQQLEKLGYQVTRY